MNKNALKKAYFDSPIGRLRILASPQGLQRLDFEDCAQALPAVQAEETPLIVQLKAELTDYFAGRLQLFSIPLDLVGTPFQRKVWQALQDIPYGETRSYKTQAITIRQPTACRAVANANGKNPVSIMVPCHRVIQSDGTLGGYGGGLDRKSWLLAHEKKFLTK